MAKPAPAPVEKDRKDLGPTGPAKTPPESHKDDAEKHPNPGNIDNGDVVGPTPTDDPRGKAKQLETEIDKKRGQTPPD